jgi:superfamily II DNA/RNA helicase
MRRLDAGISAPDTPAPAGTWRDLDLPAPWSQVVEALNPGPTPRPAQATALGELRVLEQRRNLIVAAPTNGGKSLVGHLLLLEAAARGRRAVLLEPLRALAREKADDLAAAAPRLAAVLGRPLSVRLSTGDYRLDDETFSTPPPDRGEILVATPERLDAIQRNPAFGHWLGSVGAVCVDEAQLIGSLRRGPTLEYLLTSLRQLASPPRLVLLSASAGDVERARDWLAPCDVVRVAGRYPPLRKEVWELDAGDEDEGANGAAVSFVGQALEDPAAGVLVFVYQTRSTDHLADRLRSALGDRAGPDGPLAYHARMSAARREEVRSCFRAGSSRCVVTTAALGLGVNLPATHVLVRDTTFPGVGRLDPAELLQMMGRAGRGDQLGFAVALVRPQDGWGGEELAAALREERLPGLTSHFDRPAARAGRRLTEDQVVAVANAVLARLVRQQETGVSAVQLRDFFAGSLGGRNLAGRVGAALEWLAAPDRLLAYRDDRGLFHPTVLGGRASRVLLPLLLAAGLGLLVRDLLAADPEDRLLADWRPLDHLILLQLFAEQGAPGRRFTESLAAQVDACLEAYRPATPVLYRKWIRGRKGESRAAEILGSLGIERGEAARPAAYLAVFRALVVAERGQGRSVEDLERRWKITGLEGVEERWRDEMLWLLSGLAQVLEVRSFYYHLRGECGADGGRVRRVKGCLRHMRRTALDAREQVKYCSPLGPLLGDLRRVRRGGDGPAVGVQSIRRLEEAGVRDMADLARLGTEDLVRLGVRRDLARQIREYIRRRGL